MSELWPHDPSVPGAVTGPFRSSEDHLWAELCRIDLLVRAQVLRWQALIAHTKPERLWGLIHVTEAEVATYLRSHYAPPPVFTHQLNEAVAHYRQQAARAAAVIAQSRALTPPGMVLRLDRLAELFHLSPPERDALLVCLLPELDGRYRRLFGFLQDDATRTRPSVELVMQTLSPETPGPREARAPFLANSPLLTHHLLVVAGNDEPLPLRAVRVDDRVVGYLLGSDALDARLAGLVDEMPAAVPWDHLTADADLVRRLQAWAAWWRERLPKPGAVWLLHGTPGNGQLAVAQALGTATDTPCAGRPVGS
jgi:hypothetical protein